MTQGYFITGTDTEIGKTLVSCILLHKLAQQGLKVVGMKPVASGARLNAEGVLNNADANELMNHSNVKLDYELINPYCFAPAIAPHVAAAQAGIRIELNKIAQAFHSISAQVDKVIVEGVGGWLVPLNERECVADLALKLTLPVILIVGIRLGCINHALLTYESMHHRGINIIGWIANEVDPKMLNREETIKALQNKMAIPFMGSVPYLKSSHIDVSQLTDKIKDL